MSESCHTTRTVLAYQGNITSLSENEVFVFGANLSGFHGAGSAGYASFNVTGNQWRNFNYGDKPTGWKGRWNEKGHVGAMQGTHGKSYGLVTVTRPGAKQSLAPDQLRKNIRVFYGHAEEHPDLTFLVAQSHVGGLNGYSGEAMAEFFAHTPPPRNVVFQEGFARLIAKNLSTSVQAHVRA